MFTELDERYVRFPRVILKPNFAQGRAGAKGVSHTLFTVHDKAHAGALGNVLRDAGVEVPEALMKFGQHTKRKSHSMYGDHVRTTDDLVGKKAQRITFDD